MSQRLRDPELADDGRNARELAAPGAPASAPHPDDAALAGRILAFVAVLAVADLWLYHHFRIGIRNIGIPVGLAAALGLATRGAAFLFGDDRVQAALRGTTDPVKSALRRVVTRRSLAGSAALLLAAMVLVSSVTVVADEAAPGGAVQVTALDRSAAGEPRPIEGATRTIPVWTTPFGRLYRVEAAGYVGGTFTVYPPVGLRLRLGQELAALPSLLFRPAPELLGYLADGAVLTIVRVGANAIDTLAADTGHAGSFLLGPARPITPALVDDWERELAVGELAAFTDAVNQTILAWKKPRLLPHDPKLLRLGDVLRADLSIGGVLVGSGEVTLQGAELIDVAIANVTPGSFP